MCQRCGFEEQLDRLNDMIESGDFDWADAIPEIRDWVEENGHITSKQLQAVENIEAGRTDDD